MSDLIKKFQCQCTRWGGELQLVTHTAFRALFDDETLDGYHEAPFICWHGINWWTKTVICVRTEFAAHAVIHEMGHVFCSQDPPASADEYRWLGWEIALARQLRCYRAWSAGNDGYGISSAAGDIGDAEEWGMLTTRQRQALARDRIAYGQRMGFIDDRGRPQATR